MLPMDIRRHPVILSRCIAGEEEEQKAVRGLLAAGPAKKKQDGKNAKVAAPKDKLTL